MQVAAWAGRGHAERGVPACRGRRGSDGARGQRLRGRIAGIPFILRRRPRKISTPRPDGSRARYEKWLLSIEADPEWVKQMLMETKRLALPGNGLALLPAPEGHDEAHPMETPMVGEVLDEEEADIPAHPAEYDLGPDFDETGDEHEPPIEGPLPGNMTTEEASKTAQPTAPAQPSHIQPPARPFPPAVLKSKIIATAAKHAGKALTSSQ